MTYLFRWLVRPLWDGTAFHLEGLRMELGEWHFYEIWAAALMFVVAAIYLLDRAFRHQ
jgi:hypothetical protein